MVPACQVNVVFVIPTCTSSISIYFMTNIISCSVVKIILSRVIVVHVVPASQVYVVIRCNRLK